MVFNPARDAMAKSAPRQTSHITPHDPETAQKPAAELLAAPDVSQPVGEPITRQGFWFALVFWTMIFVILMGLLLYDLVISLLFRR
jgi:hypothetical protein